MKLFSKAPIGFLTKATMAAMMVFAIEANAQTETNTQVGILNCTVEGGVGLLLGSSKRITCTFNKKGGDKELYIGKVLKLGLDIGITKKSIIS